MPRFDGFRSSFLSSPCSVNMSTVRRAIAAVVTSATGAVLMRLTSIVVPQPTIHRPKRAFVQVGEASPPIARAPCSRAVVVVAKSATYALGVGSDASAPAGASAADVVLVLMAAPRLPAAIGAPPTMTARLPSLVPCVGQPIRPTAREVGPARLVHAKKATPASVRALAAPALGATGPLRPEASTDGLIGAKARLPGPSAGAHLVLLTSRVPSPAMDVRTRTSTGAVRQELRIASAEVVMTSAMASLASTPCAVRWQLAASPLASISRMRFLVAMAIALQGVQVPASDAAALDTRQRRTVVRTPATRASPTDVRTEALGRVVQAPVPDVELLPASTCSVQQDAADGGRQEEGVVAALATISGRASVALPIRTAVVALIATRLSRIAIPPSRAEAISTSASMATKAIPLVLITH